MHPSILLSSNRLSNEKYSFTVASIAVLLLLSSPRKFRIADIPLLLQILAVDNAFLYVLPETHFLATLNNSRCSKPVLLSGLGVLENETSSEYQFLVLITIYTYCSYSAINLYFVYQRE